MPDMWECFGIEVRKARTVKGWTQTNFAHEAFGNQDREGDISQIEKGAAEFRR